MRDDRNDFFGQEKLGKSSRYFRQKIVLNLSEMLSNGWEKAIRFSSLGIEMGVVIFGSAFLGDYLDEYNQMETRYYTVGFSLLGVFFAIYRVMKKLMK